MTFLVNEQGYHGASVDKVSARLKLAKGAFYHHNDNKQDLISACFERTFSVVRYQLSENGSLLRSSSTRALPDQVHRDSVRKTMLRLTEHMDCVVVDGVMDGSTRPLDPVIAALVAIGVINASAQL